jgi:hypothetical protein
MKIKTLILTLTLTFSVGAARALDPDLMPIYRQGFYEQQIEYQRREQWQQMREQLQQQAELLEQLRRDRDCDSRIILFDE